MTLMTYIGDNTKASYETDGYVRPTLTTEQLDSLEYDCWELFKKYAEKANINLESEYGEEDDIDFYFAKAIQDKILELFSKEDIEIRVAI